MSELVRRFAPATERNREPILAVLRRVLPSSGLLLEVASGTGEHTVFFAQNFPSLRFQPSDVDPGALSSINAWIEHCKLPNVLAPLVLDAASAPWPIASADVIFNANMIHISPWETCLGLMQGASRILSPEGLLYLYGPFQVGGVHISTSNEKFDQSLRAQNPSWGVRNLEDVVAVAQKNQLSLQEKITMPANNFSLIFRRS